MKVVVFAHIPPPHHGQSYMVQLMLEGLGSDHRHNGSEAGKSISSVECYHVNARLSKDLEDIGGIRVSKLFLLFGHCLEALWCRFRYGASTLYYVPAPGKAAALYRDWVVMAICRPFFNKVVFHWHATSLANWLEQVSGETTRALTYFFLGKADLSIALSKHNARNAEKLWPRRLAIVPNGIPDPCPEFVEQVLPRRLKRLNHRKMALDNLGGVPAQEINVLFLAHCTREKGLFDAVKAVLFANAALRKQNQRIYFRLHIAGNFRELSEKDRLEQLLEQENETNAVKHIGFVQGARKTQVLRDADILCFPSHWENQPVSVIESLAFGLPAVITTLPSVQEIMPKGYAEAAEVGNIRQIAEAMKKLAFYDNFVELRQHFLREFAVETFCRKIAAALEKV